MNAAAANGHDEALADHWWWRPGWRVGRSFYTWHITFEDQPSLHKAAEAYRSSLRDLPGLDLVPDQWLHLTMQGVGFTDEVTDTDIDTIVHAVRDELASMPSFTLDAGRVLVTDEAIQFQPMPQQPLAALRNAVRNGITRAWGHCPEPDNGFVGHITIAYSNSKRSAAPYITAVEDTHRALNRPTDLRVASVSLIELNRDHQAYQWQTHTRLDLAGYTRSA